jgi:N-acetylglucosamine-6-phosphate deacetylase
MSENNQTCVFIGRIALPEKIADSHVVQVQNGRISTILEGTTAEAQALVDRCDTVVQLEENEILCPGFIDLHIHGLHGADVMDGTPEALATMCAALPQYGVTSFFPTTMTATYEILQEVLLTTGSFIEQFLNENMCQGGAAPLGIHLEGPWIHKDYIGAQNPSYIQQPSLSAVQEVYRWAKGRLNIVTLAPEREGALEVIRFLSEKQVVSSVAHSSATFEEILEAMEAGLSHVTHTFNAMTGLHHRQPGIVGAALGEEQLTTEVIADMVHVHERVISLLYRLKGKERLALITDSIRATGLPDGEYELGGQTVIVAGGKASLAGGSLAGSILTMNRAVQNMVEHVGVPLAEALYMASATPARISGFSKHKGLLREQYDADLIIFNSSTYEVKATWVGGHKVWQKQR